MERSARQDPDGELPPRGDRYEAFLQIGSGGMARVYLGVQHGPFGSKRLVVLKQLRREVANDKQFIEMFVDEARIALRLSHPNVVHTYEVLAEAPEYHLVMEFLDGQTLLQVLRRLGRKNVPLHEHIWVLTQLLAGLHYAHDLCDFDGTRLGIVHCDISPSNLFICHSGAVKLLDFGIAKASGALAATRQGVLQGKLGYVAPEQCLGQPANVRSDVYAVGVMLWEAMAGRRRVAGDTQVAQIQARIRGSEPPIERVWPEAPPALIEIVRRALHSAPDQRYVSALEFQHDLEQYLAQVGSHAGAESLSRLVRPHFEQDRATLYRVIEAQLGTSQHGVLPDRLGSATPEGFASSAKGPLFSAVATKPDGEVNTSPIPVDHALLRASKLDYSLAPEERSVEVMRSQRPWSSALLRLVPRSSARFGRRSSVVALLLALGTGTGAAAWRVLATRSEPTAATTLASPASRVASSAPRTASPEQIAPGEVTLVTLRIAVAPAHAVLHLDGQLLQSNPYEARVQRDDREHELSATAVSHRPERRKLHFDADIDLQLSLVPTAVSSVRRATSTARTARAQPAGRSVLEAASATPQIDPGSDLRVHAVERIKRSIDEQDPYQP